MSREPEHGHDSDEVAFGLELPDEPDARRLVGRVAAMVAAHADGSEEDAEALAGIVLEESDGDIVALAVALGWVAHMAAASAQVMGTDVAGLLRTIAFEIEYVETVEGD